MGLPGRSAFQTGLRRSKHAICYGTDSSVGANAGVIVSLDMIEKTLKLRVALILRRDILSTAFQTPAHHPSICHIPRNQWKPPRLEEIDAAYPTALCSVSKTPKSFGLILEIPRVNHRSHHTPEDPSAIPRIELPTNRCSTRPPIHASQPGQIAQCLTTQCPVQVTSFPERALNS